MNKLNELNLILAKLEKSIQSIYGKGRDCSLVGVLSPYDKNVTRFNARVGHSKKI